MHNQEFIIRPLKTTDLDWLIEISKMTGPGLTSIPNDIDYLTRRTAIVDKSFQEILPPEQRIYLFVHENIPSGEKVGLSGIQACTGYNDIFYNYEINTLLQSCKSLNIKVEHKILNVSHNHQNSSELISFWIHPNFRGKGVSRALSLSRFMFIAQYPELFGTDIIAEIRGVSDASGNSPFWEAIGRHFFAMDFARADALTMTSDKQFIADLISHEPIYMDLLPQDALDVVGIEHPTSTGARRILESQGLKYTNYVDIFDAGPLLSANSQHIDTIANSKNAKVTNSVSNIENGIDAIIYNARFDAKFTRSNIILDANNEVIISNTVAKNLDITRNDTIRYYHVTKD